MLSLCLHLLRLDLHNERVKITASDNLQNKDQHRDYKQIGQQRQRQTGLAILGARISPTLQRTLIQYGLPFTYDQHF